jgi:MoxR-like ATPase
MTQSFKVPVEGLRGRVHAYIPDAKLIAAVNAAILLGRPLLLTGEPGCGKSEFAYAVAHAAGVSLLEAHVRSDSRARDLLYHYDALHRFGEAQIGEAAVKRDSVATMTKVVDPRNYIEILPFGRALIAPTRQVVLIDEIDKAPRDLPNDLLREIDRGEFEISEIPKEASGPGGNECWGRPLARTMKRPEGAPAPIVIITSNVERQLPEPFLRRCLFFHINFPETKQLEAILRAHVGEFPYLERVVKTFEAVRDIRGLAKKPATSELIDWVQVLRGHHGENAEQALGQRLEDRRWRDLPALHCLIKMREDLEIVSR